MKLVELSENDKDSYNLFVINQPTGSFLQAWEWGDWQESLGKKTSRFFLTDGGGTAAAIQVVQNPLPFGRYYLYAPYGPVADLRFKIEDLRFILQELQKIFPNAVFIRLEPKAQILDLNQVGRKTVNIQPGKTLVINLEKPEDQILAEMHPKTRYNIKLARRHGIKILSDAVVVPGHGLYVQEALDLIMRTSERQGFQTFPLGYYQKFLDFFALHNPQSGLKLYIYKALLDRELLSVAIMVDFGKTRSFLFGGSSERHREVMAPHLLHFTALADARKLGLKFYDFWGVETATGDTPGFVRFKMGFGGQTVVYAGAWDIANNKLWYHSYKVLRRANRIVIKLRLWRRGAK